MITKILVPLAFSKYSKGILRFAADLAAATGAELLVANVINQRSLEAVNKITSFGYNVDVEHYVETIKKERREELKKIMGEVTLSEQQATLTFCVGDPANELLKMVIDRGVDVVVMGVKAHDFSHIFTGSVAEKMFQKCPVTVISYRDEEISDKLRRKLIRHLGNED